MSEQDVVPRWRCIKRAEVELEPAASDGERGALADSVGSHKPEQSHWQPVKSKVIGAVRVRHSSELARQVDELHAAAGSMLTPCEARRAGLLPDRYFLFVCAVRHRDAWAATLAGLEKVPSLADFSRSSSSMRRLVVVSAGVCAMAGAGGSSPCHHRGRVRPCPVMRVGCGAHHAEPVAAAPPAGNRSDPCI